jgi:hypothetical protein
MDAGLVIARLGMVTRAGDRAVTRTLRETEVNPQSLAKFVCE